MSDEKEIDKDKITSSGFGKYALFVLHTTYQDPRCERGQNSLDRLK